MIPRRSPQMRLSILHTDWWQFFCTCLCLLMLAVLAVVRAYLYPASDPPWRGSMSYLEEGDMVELGDGEDGGGGGGGTMAPFPWRKHLLHESVHVLEAEELVVIEVPGFPEGHGTLVLHDFRNRMTTYRHPKPLRCYFIPLNSSTVLRPSELTAMLTNIKDAAYLPHAVLVRERFVVVGRLDGPHLPRHPSIARLCYGLPVYRLQRRNTTSGIHKREAPDCHKILHFENVFVVETQICLQ